MKTILRIFLACALFCAAGVRAQQTPPSGAALIAVSKESMTLAVYDLSLIHILTLPTKRIV